MSNSKFYWYSLVKKMIMTPQVATERSLQASVLRNAMEEAETETLTLPDGPMRMLAVKKILIDQTMTYERFEIEYHYCRRTIQKWINSYVKLVGKKAGY